MSYHSASMRIPNTVLLRSFCLLLAFSTVLSGCTEADPREEALKLQAQGKYEESLAPLRKLLEVQTDDSEINYLYGRALTAIGQPSLAEWSLRKAARDPEWLTPAGTQIALGALRSGNHDNAIQMCLEVLEVDPDNIDVMLILSQSYAQSRMNYEKSLEYADRILELEPDNAEAMEPRIVSLIGLLRIDEAAAAIEKLGEMIEAADSTSDAVRSWHCTTTALFADESDDKVLAEERWEVCLENFPGQPKVVEGSMRFFDAKGETTRGQEILRAAIEVEPSSLDFRRRLALRYSYTGELDKAEAVLLEGTEISTPQFKPIAWQILAKHYQDAGQHEKAADAMKSAVEASRALGPVDPQLLFDYADALILQMNLDAALSVAEEMTIVPHQEMIRARVAQERGNHIEALDHYEQAFLLWPDNPWARYFAARSAESTGQFERAIELYRYAIRLQSDATDARSRLASLYVAEGNVAEAMAILQINQAAMPLKMDGELLSIELFALSGQQKPLTDSIEKFSVLGKYAFGRALAAVGRGARVRFGPEVAAQILERYGATGLEVQDPDRPDALSGLIELKSEAGAITEVEPAVRAAVAAQPDSAALHAVLARWLELSGAPEAERRAALDRALELDAENAAALSGMGRLLLPTDPEAALGFFDRATAADPRDVAAPLAAARILIASGRGPEAADRLASLLEEHAFAADAALELVELQLASGTATTETEALARRAVRFGGGLAALETLGRVYRAIDEPQKATEIEERVRARRSKDAEASTAPAE
jgi:tetratricopeptide (TPR) repeat protein